LKTKKNGFVVRVLMYLRELKLRMYIMVSLLLFMSKNVTF